jgi:myosin-15
VRRTQIFFPGDTVVENEVNAVTTAQDVVDDICDLIGAFDPLEYGLFVRTGKGKMMPLRPSDYLIDAIRTLELRNIKYRLYFRKVLWYSPISLENDLHVELLQEQAMEDYTKAALISFQEPRWTEADIVFLAAAQFSVSPISRVSQVSIHDIDEDALVESVPKCVRHLLTPLEWTQRIIAEAESLEASYKADVQRLYLETIIDLFPMYGSSFFPVSECSDQRIRGGRCLLAVDRNGVYFLDKATKVVLFSYPFNEIMSTRRLGSYNDERHYVDLKVGTLVTQKAIRIEPPHALLFTTVITRYIQKHIQAARGE